MSTEAEVPATPSKPSKKRKLDSGQKKKSRKRLRQNGPASHNQATELNNTAVRGTNTDFLISVKPVHVEQLVTRAATFLSWKGSLSDSVERLWLYSRAPARELRYVATVRLDKGQLSDSREAEDGSVQRKYEVLEIWELRDPLGLKELRRKGYIDDVPEKQMPVPAALVADVSLEDQIKVFDGLEAEDPEEEPVEEPVEELSELQAQEPVEETVPPLPPDWDKGPTPFCRQTVSLRLPLAPIAQSYALEGLCAEHLSPLILTYYPPFKGVVLAYLNPRLSNDPYSFQGATAGSEESKTESSPSMVLASCGGEYAPSFVWVTADFTLLRPRSGTWVTGWVNLQTASHIGLVCWNLFGASIGRERLPAEWRWKGGSEPSHKNQPKGTSTSKSNSGQDHDRTNTGAEEGYFVNAEGKKVSGWLRFRIRDFETAPASAEGEKGFLTLQGTLLSEEAEAELTQRELRPERTEGPSGPVRLARARQPEILGAEEVLRGGEGQGRKRILKTSRKKASS